MTSITAWLLGLLAIASVVMALGIWPVIHAEVRANDGPWWRNKSLRLSCGLWFHSLGAIVIFWSPIVAHENERTMLMLALLWTGYTLWLIAKTLVISVSSRLQLAICLYALWTIYIVAARGS